MENVYKIKEDYTQTDIQKFVEKFANYYSIPLYVENIFIQKNENSFIMEPFSSTSLSTPNFFCLKTVNLRTDNKI